ncbi:hypothetical protein [Nocardioides alcanivorans]|uniref:hypothetical protein n=1 Tax=Nocardioides alcanivorans TaxID=2897352 RepID=UPI001F2DDDAF|nr:hypothetical protein [Nocardioides alcanivorans]
MPLDSTTPLSSWPGRLTEPRHVWVDVTGGSLPARPGLVVMWRRMPGPRGGWQAWVISVSRGAVEQGWQHGYHVRPWAGEESAVHVHVRGGTSERDGGLGLLVDWRPVNRVEGSRECLVVWACWQPVSEYLGVRVEWVAGDRVRAL